MSEQDEYRKIAKNTAILGGSQVAQMITTLIRTKIIAILLGPVGMGVNILILSALSTIQQFSSFGIFQSGVRDLSYTYENKGPLKFAILQQVFNHITFISGLFGVAICLLLSPLLSQLSFGNLDYTWSFAIVSISLLFIALQNGIISILQSTKNLQLIAKSTIVGAILNLTITTPIFYFFKIKGIVPSIIIGYIILYLTYKHYKNKIKFTITKTPTKSQTIAYSKPILKLGAVLMTSSLTMVTFTFLLNIFIRYFGTMSDVGLYQSASAICLQSMVIINVTLASDYFPRLSAAHNDPKKMLSIVNKQAEIVTMIIIPISVLILALAPLIIYALYSEEYLSIVPILQIMSLSLIFRSLWMILSFIILAKGDQKTYLFFDAFIGHGLNFILNIVAFYFMQLYGLGIAYLLGAISMTTILTIVIKIKYKFIFKRKIIITTFIYFIILVSMYIFRKSFMEWKSSIIMWIIIIVLIYYCFSRLNKMLNISQFISNKFSK
ncbi:oligosaccharide flippase family protein [Parabacteroides sp. APC149_11_2_Y6]